jgi:RNA polymerase sigma-70 factor (ECF subfamily)
MPYEAARSVTATPHGLSDDEFRRIYEAHFRYVWHSLRRLGIPERDLEDLCHDVFVAFYRGREGYDVGRPIKPWLFGIAFRVASDFRRRMRHRFEIPGAGVEPADPSPSPDEKLAAAQRRRLVSRALEALDLGRRAVFVLHDLDGCSMPEIARVLDAPLNTLYSRLRLARAEFAAAVKRLGPPDQPQERP